MDSIVSSLIFGGGGGGGETYTKAETDALLDTKQDKAPVITFAASQAISADPVTVHFTDEQNAIMIDDTISEVVFDASALGGGFGITRMSKSHDPETDMYTGTVTIPYGNSGGSITKIWTYVYIYDSDAQNAYIYMKEYADKDYVDNHHDDTKLDANQGVANVGKIMGVDTDGDVVPVEAPTPIYRTVTLTAAGWVNKAQTVTVTGVSATETAQLIQPVPALASQAAYYDSAIKATAQAANSLTFECDTVPSADLTVYVVITEVSA